MPKTAWILIAIAITATEAAPVPPEQAAGAESPVVLIETTMGDIRLELDHARAPRTVENFLRYVQAGFYEGTLIHRVVEGFVIQGGGYTADLDQKTTLFPPVPFETAAGLRNLRGTVAMARGLNPDSATCQFFINLADNPSLDYHETTNPNHAYAVFGRVIEGMDVVDRIGRVPLRENSADIGPDGIPARTLPVNHVQILRVRFD